MENEPIMKTKRLTRTRAWAGGLPAVVMLAAVLMPGVGMAQTNLSLAFTSPATNASPGATFTGILDYAPINMVISAAVTAGTGIVPQTNLTVTVLTTNTVQVTLVPLTNTSGEVSVDVEGVTADSTNTVPFTVVFRPYPPAIAPISNQSMLEDGTKVVSFTVSDPDTDPDTLDLWRSSSNTNLIDLPGMILGGSGTNRTITLTPKPDINGTSVVTLAVSDGTYTNTRSFNLVVTPVADPSTITGLVNRAFGDNAGVTNVFTGVAINDVDHNMPLSEQLVATATLDSDQFARFANNQITFSSTGTPSQVTSAIAGLGVQAIPFRAMPGTINNVAATVRVRGVADGITVSNTITLAIEVINTPPTFNMTLNPTSVVEGVSAQPFHVDFIYDPDIGESAFTLAIELAEPGQAPLISIGPSSSLVDNIAGLQAGVRNISVNPATGVMTNATEAIPLRYTLTDGFGGGAVMTNILTLLQEQNAPLITGIPDVTFNKTDADPPFVIYPTVFIQELDQGGVQQVSATLSQSMPSLGTLSSTNFALMTPAQLSAALRTVDYTPASGVLPVGASAESTFTLRVTDVIGLDAVNSSVKARITGVNNAPQILNVPPPDQQPVLIPPAAPLLPFAAIGLTNDDTNQVQFTLSIDNTGKGSLGNLGGFSQTSPGVFQMAGSTTAILGALTNITYTLDPAYLFPPDDPGGTTFTLSARDYAFLTRTHTLYIQVQDEPRNHLVIRTRNDGLPGSFTYALASAGNNDVITFALPAYPAIVRLPGTSPSTLIRNITIKGPGANLLAISGDGNGDMVPDRQLFRIRSRVTMEGITFTHGTASFGGAMLVERSGFLTLRQCAVVDSVATQYGGAIDVDGGQLTLDGCFIARNRLADDFGMSGAGVSVYSDKEIRIVNTTFAENVQANDSGDGGGALVVQNLTASTPMSAYIIHSTFVGNEDASGRASAALGIDFGTRLRVWNSIFSDFSGRNLDVAGAADIVSLGGNICDDSTRTTFFPEGLLNALSDSTLTDPLLAPLNLAGDPTPFHEPLPGSPAIGKGQGSTISVDQRGVLRQGVADAGAIEFNAQGRLVINEVFFEDSAVNYLEIYVRRDSAPIDLAPYSLYVDGVKVHDFADSTIAGTNTLFPAAGVAADTLVRPGFGMLVAFTNNGPFSLTSPINVTPVVGLSVTNAAQDLKAKALVTIGQGGTQGPIARQAYLGTYLDPATGTNLLNTAGNSLSLAPWFRGFCLIPNSFILPGPFGGADTTLAPGTFPKSPGADSSGTPFGQDNAEPLAVADILTVTEDDLSLLPVLANDYDSDGGDRLVIVDVSTVSAPDTGDISLTQSELGAWVQIDPSAVPLRGERLLYDPRLAPVLQALPVGVEIIDTFYYEIIDIGSAPVDAYGASGSNTVVTAINHRLATGDAITISGASYAPYNDTFAVVVLDADTFTIPVEYTVPVAVPGLWETVLPRAPTARSEARVSVRVIGVNDPPVAVPDLITNVTEDATVRIMTRPELAGSALSFPGDPVPAPVMLAQDVLSNDFDIDSDDNWSTLRVVGVLGGVNLITSYAGTPGQTPVAVHAPAHGLSTGEKVLIANYGGHSSYNGYHTVSVLDDDTFTIAKFFVDNHAEAGVWVRLDESNRYAAVTDVGAAVTLILRADQQEDHMIYNAATSAFLQGLAEDELYTNRFYYAVADSHGGIGIGPLDVVVTGLNNAPSPQDDPAALGLLGPLVNAGSTLENVLSGGLDLMYILPPASGGSGLVDLHVRDTSGTLAGTVVLADFLVTDEDTPLPIDSADLLANDSDIDRLDVLGVAGVDAASREGAALSLAGGIITYDPTVSSNLQALARGEMRIDTFGIIVSDGMTGGSVTSLVAVLVIGVNDAPIANPVSLTTHEDEVFVFDPRLNDIVIDFNAMEPDNRLGIVAVTNWPNPGLAQVDMRTTNVTHDATVSALLNQLADWQSYTNVFNYTITDNSFLFAVDDTFHVPAGMPAQMLDVLANDRDFTDADGILAITGAGPALHGGSITIASNGTHLVYGAPVGFVGDDYFRYTIRNDRGDVDSGLVMVRSVVPALNGDLQAADDAFAVAAGETVVMNVLANDNMLPLTGAGLTITALVDSSIPGQPILSNNAFTFAATNGLAPLTFTYEVTAGGSSTSRADVVVTVVERRGTLPVRDDTFSVLPGSFGNELDVLANDGLVTASTAGLRIREILDPAVYGTLTTNSGGTRLLYSPQAGFVGTEQVRYLATDQAGGTGTGTVSIIAGQLETVPDFYTLAATTSAVPVTLDVLANDRVLPNPKGTLTILSVDPALPTAIGTLQVGGGGTHLLFFPSNSVGQMVFSYEVRDAGLAARSATGQVTIATVPSGIYANPDRYRVRGGGSGYVLPVLGNDISYPNVNKAYSILSIGTGADAPDHGGLVSIVGNALVYSPAAGFFGEESFTYFMSDSVETDVARVTVSVRRGDLFANDDDYAVFYEYEPGTNIARRFSLPVLLNDRILPPLDQIMEINALGTGTNAPSLGGLLEISADKQTLLYRPVAVPANSYVERFSYEISDGGNRRASGVVRVRVENRAGGLIAVTGNDAFAVARNSVNNTLPVLANDFVLPGTASGWSVTGVSTTAFGGAASANGASVRYSPPADFTGKDSFTYSVSDGFGGTGNATVLVQVGSLPVTPDLFTVLSGSVSNEFDVVLNDVLDPAYAGEYTLDGVFGTTAGGLVSLSPDNTVFYTPAPAYAGGYPYTETFFYRVNDDAAAAVTGQVDVIVHDAFSGQGTSTISLLVEGRNDQPTIDNASTNLPITDKQTAQPFLGVTISEVDQQLLEPVDVRVSLDLAGKGSLTNLTGFADQGDGSYLLTNVPAATATLQVRDLVFVPTENRITVPTSETTFFSVSVTDNKSAAVVDTNSAVQVAAVNDAPVISGTLAGQEFYYRLPIQPFAGVTIAEVDDLALQSLGVTVAIMQPANGRFGGLGDFVDLGNGIYWADGITAAAATAQLRAMAFFVETGTVPVGGSITTGFRITVNDSFAPPVTDQNTSVTAYHPFESAVRPALPSQQGSFGLAVDTIDDYAVVGAPNASVSGTNSGAAFVYQRVTGTTNAWVQWRQLQPATVSTNDRFGRSVSMTDNGIAVGAINDGAGGVESGAVYLFDRDAGGTNNWGEIVRIVPTNLTSGARFGQSVSLDGDLLAVGAPDADLSGTGVKAGAVLLFGRHQGGANAWGEIMRWAPADAGSTNALFGWSLALSGEHLVVGAPQYNATGTAAEREGAVFHLSRDVGGPGLWGLSQTLTAPDLTLSREFGWDVSVDGDLVAVGAPAMTAGTVTNAGRVFMYEKTAGTNTFGLVRTLDRRNDVERRFGHSVSVSGDQVFIGAPHNATPPNLGVAYLFDRPDPSNTVWIVAEKFTRPDGSPAGLFGTDVRYQQGAAIVGAPSNLDEVSNRGYAFMYRFGYNTLPVLSYSLTIDPTSRSHGVDAASGQTIGVAANAFWTATLPPADSWITITSGSAGGGNGTVTYSISAHSAITPRSGTITVSGGGITRTFTVNQDAVSAALVISPSNRVHSSASATGQVIDVTANVAWTATRTAAWITLTGGTSGTGNGTVTYSVSTNSVTAPRSGTITVSGSGITRTFTVNQDAAPAALAISPASRNHASASATGQAIGVTANVAWTATRTNAWITITGGSSGTGNGTVTYSISANTVPTPRSGDVTVSGGGITRTFTVNQDAAPAALAISPASRDHASTSASGQTIGVTANVAWTATRTDAWITITGGDAGTGNGTVTYSISANSVMTPRSGTITVDGGGITRTFTVNQAGSGPAISIGDAVDAPELAWTSGGFSNVWFGQTLTTRDGVDAAQSGVIEDNQQIWMQTTVTGPGTLSFWWKVSSEANSDYLAFSANGVEQNGRISGETGWQRKEWFVPLGDWTLRWFYAKDAAGSSGADGGWVDQVIWRRTLVANDFDGDRKSDLGYYHAQTGAWRLLLSDGGTRSTSFGYQGTIPFSGDFDGDGIVDYGCYDPNGIPGAAAPGSWYIMQSRRGFRTETFGYPGTVPIVGDFDGDGITDFGCYDAAGIPGLVPPGSWYIMQSRLGFRTATFGYQGTIPIVGDFDGDGITDFGCYDPNGIPGAVAPGSWYIMQSRRGFRTETFGYSGTIPIVGDFDGDGEADFGCYDASGIPGIAPPGSWYIMQSNRGFRTATFGYTGTIPVVGDYDGDGKSDFGCYDPDGIPGAVDPGTWFIMQSRDGFRRQTWGRTGTVPLGK